MIRVSMVLVMLAIATSRITGAADPSFNDRYFAAMEARPAVPAKPSVKKVQRKPTQQQLAQADRARHRAQYSPPPKLTFDGVHYWNEQGEAVAMKTRCKACRIGR